VSINEGPNSSSANKQGQEKAAQATDDQKVGTIAGIVAGTIAGLAILAFIIGFLIYRSYVKKNIQSMNFDNPVYRKTTEDQFSLEKNQYQPSRLPSTLEPLTAGQHEVV